SDLITVADRDGLLSYVSPASQRVLGYAPNELVGRTLLSLRESDTREHLGEGLPSSPTPIFRCRRKDGSHAWLEVKSYTSSDTLGEIVEVFSIARDVT